MISWNRGAERIFGYTEAEVVGKPLSMLMPERFRPMHDAGIKRVVDGGVAASKLIGETVEVVGLRKDGREFPLELSLATWDTPNGRFFSGIIRDITERKKAEDKIRALLETAPDPIVEVDHDAASCWPTRAPTSSSATTARRSSSVRSRSCSPSARARSSPSASTPCSAARDADGSFGLAPGPLGPAQGRHRVPGRRHAQHAADRRRHRRHEHHPRRHRAQALRDPAQAPGRPRRAHRALQPPPLRGGARRVRRLRRALQRVRRRPAARPRPLQVRQRHARPQGRRRGHPRRRRRPARQRAQERRGRPPRRRRVRRPAARTRAAPRPSASPRRCSRPSASADLPLEGQRVTMTTRIGVALFGERRPAASRTCSSTPTSRCTPPRTPAATATRSPRRDGEHLTSMQARLGWVDQIRRGARRGPLRPLLPADPAPCDATRSRSGSCCCAWSGEDGELIPPAVFIPTAERFGLIQEIDRWVVKQRHPPARTSTATAPPRCGSRSTSPASRWSTTRCRSMVEREIAPTGIDPEQPRLRDHRDRRDRQHGAGARVRRPPDAASAAASRSTTSAPASRPSTTSSTCR